MKSVSYDPEEIRRRSYRHIRENLPVNGRDPAQQSVAESVVHTSGDFGLADHLSFSDDPIPSALNSRPEATIVTDVGMVRQGIRASLLDRWGAETFSYVHDDETHKRANEDNLTRSAAGLDVALDQHESFWLVVGNAPTTLARLIECHQNGTSLRERIPIVIGAPVGFVAVRETKSALESSGFPSITIQGTRGGSPLAATITNTLLNWEPNDE
ncbi:MAG: precorrin-8X methylmutase [bacterium]